MSFAQPLVIFISLFCFCLTSTASDAFADEFIFEPDSKGNLKEHKSGKANIRVTKGDRIRFQKLKPNDQIIEIDTNVDVTADQLCSTAVLPEAIAHEVLEQDPLPPGLYPAKEISGPYHPYPAGIYVMSPSSDECRFVESNTGVCPDGTDQDDKSVFEYNGISYRLCQTKGHSCTKGELLDSLWTNPGIQGVFLRIDWKDVNPALNQYDWDVVDRAFIKAIANSKNIMLGIRLGGNAIPEWIFDDTDSGGMSAVRVMLRDWGSGGADLPNNQCGFDYVSSSPSDANFRQHYFTLLDKLAEHIRADQRRFSVLTGVKVTGLGQQTLENRAPKRCNIAQTIRGASEPEGYLILPEFTNDMQVGIDTRYQDIKFADRQDCICNPSAFSEAGYRPSHLYSFYNELALRLQKNFGYKQKTYMNISAGFPQIAENGRFMGDHLDHYIFDPDVEDADADTHPRLLVAGRAHQVDESNLPTANEQTQTIIANGRAAANFNGNASAPFGWGVENAALDLLPLDVSPTTGKCTQQVSIESDPDSPFYGSAKFPGAKNRSVDNRTENCPNVLAVEEGMNHGKVIGFQVRNVLGGAEGMDSALWNMTLNSNALFFEAYERNLWRANIETNGGKKVLKKKPSIKSIVPTDKASQTKNSELAKAKTLKEWNQLLLARANKFSTKKSNSFLKNPHPDSYSVKVVGGNAVKYIFNARACSARNGRNVRINKISFGANS